MTFPQETAEQNLFMLLELKWGGGFRDHTKETAARNFLFIFTLFFFPLLIFPQCHHLNQESRESPVAKLKEAECPTEELLENEAKEKPTTVEQDQNKVADEANAKEEIATEVTTQTVGEETKKNDQEVTDNEAKTTNEEVITGKETMPNEEFVDTPRSFNR
jgi:hypothetical protein